MQLTGSYEQSATVDKADLWTAEQAKRLGVKSSEILDAIRSGWTAWDVTRLSAANTDDLTGPPPHIISAIRKIRNAPILPVRLSYSTKRRLDR
jgi:hypothetical protein